MVPSLLRAQSRTSWRAFGHCALAQDHEDQTLEEKAVHLSRVQIGPNLPVGLSGIIILTSGVYQSENMELIPFDPLLRGRR